MLLKNDGLLPLDRQKIKRIAVIGGNADSVPMLVGNYNGTPTHPSTILKGIHQLLDGTRGRDGARIQIIAVTNMPFALPNRAAPVTDFSAAIAAAKSADVVIYAGGLDATLEREEKKGLAMQGFSGGDRTAIELPQTPDDLLRALHATGKPVVFVNCSGSAIAMPWAKKTCRQFCRRGIPASPAGGPSRKFCSGSRTRAANCP